MECRSQASAEGKQALIEPHHPELSICRQCALLSLNGASLSYEPVPQDPLNLELMRRIDEQYLQTPFYGWPRMTAVLHRQGYEVNGKRVRRLMQQMGLQALTLHKRPTTSTPGHRVYPYLLRDVVIERPMRSGVLTLRMYTAPGFVYVVAIMDWFSRYVVTRELSNSREGNFCRTALERALQSGQPAIFNTDQGSQFTAQGFTTL